MSVWIIGAAYQEDYDPYYDPQLEHGYFRSERDALTRCEELNSQAHKEYQEYVDKTREEVYQAQVEHLSAREKVRILRNNGYPDEPDPEVPWRSKQQIMSFSDWEKNNYHNQIHVPIKLELVEERDA